MDKNTDRIIARNLVVKIYEDPHPDLSYLDQKEFKDRRRAFYKGDFHFIGIVAECEILSPIGALGSGSFLINRLHSGGIWEIESDSGEDYIEEVATEEFEALIELLQLFNAEVPEEWKAENVTLFIENSDYAVANPYNYIDLS